jgi:hypothetical protein
MSASSAAVLSNAEAEGGKKRFAVSSSRRSWGYLDAVLVLVLVLMLMLMLMLVLVLVLGIRAWLSLWLKGPDKG